MHHPLFPPLPLFALREKDVYVYICMRVKARIRLKRTRKKISSPSSHRERLFSLDDSWNTFTHVHYEPLSLPFPKTNESRIQNRFQIYARHNTCATPSHRIAVCYWRNWGSVFVRPACRSNDSFVSPSPLPPPGGHCFFGLSTKLISRWQRVLLRFLPR